MSRRLYRPPTALIEAIAWALLVVLAAIVIALMREIVGG